MVDDQPAKLLTYESMLAQTRRAAHQGADGARGAGAPAPGRHRRRADGRQHAGARRLRARGDDPRASALPAHRDHLRVRRAPDGPRPRQGLRDRRRRLRVGAGRAGDPAREDRRLRRPLPQDDRARAAQPHARGARARAHGGARGHDRAAARAASTGCACRAKRSPRPTGARTNSSRCLRTSCAIRCSRSAPPSSSLRQASATPEQLAWSREVIDRQVNQLVRLVDDLLDASRISSGKLELRREPVDLVPIITGAVESSRALADRRHQQVDAALPQHPGLRRRRRGAPHAGIPQPAQQRREVQPERRERISLGVDARRRNRRARARRRYGHCGRTTSPRVFEMFYQGSAKPDDAQGGLGLGLALVQQLVGAARRARSKRTAKVPAGAANSSCSCRRSSSNPSRRARRRTRAAETRAPCRRILVVDDNRDAAETLAMMLRLEGNEVEHRVRRGGRDCGDRAIRSRRRADGPRHAQGRRVRSRARDPPRREVPRSRADRADRLGRRRRPAPVARKRASIATSSSPSCRPSSSSSCRRCLRAGPRTELAQRAGHASLRREMGLHCSP